MNLPEIWIGLAEIRQRPGAGLLLDRNDAYTNVLAVAQTQDGFRETVVAGFAQRGFDLLDLEDAEPLQQRLQRYSVSDDLLALAAQVKADGMFRFGTLHTFTSND